MRLKFSWILPIKNEAQSLPQLFSEISTAMKNQKYEIIAINDASSDNTLKVLKSFPQVITINNVTHQGKWASLEQGFLKSSGDWIITTDADLQDNPQEIKKLLKKIDLGYQIISGYRQNRLDPFYKILLSNLGNKLVSLLFGFFFKDLNSPFKIYHHSVLKNLPKQGSLFRFSLLFGKLLNYKIIEVPILHRPRLYGASKFGIEKYLRILYDLILIRSLFSGSGRLSNPRNNTRI